MRDINADGTVVGRPYQSVHEASTHQHYPIGTIFDSFGLRKIGILSKNTAYGNV